MIVYIAGPITGTTDAVERFAAAERQLNEAGFTDVINPTQVQLGDGATWLDYMRATVRLLAQADGVCLLDGWHRSRGARVEQMWARGVGLRVGRLDEWLSVGRSLI